MINRAGDAFTATAAFDVVDANDVLIRAGCATETATRLESRPAGTGNAKRPAPGSFANVTRYNPCTST